MSKTEQYLEMFVEKMGDNLMSDLRRIVPKHIETLIEMRFKGIRSALEPLERIEVEQKAQGRDIENLTIAYKKLEQDFAELKIQYDSLPKKMQDVVQEGHSNLSDVIEQKIEEIPLKAPLKKKRLGKLKFWKKKGIK